MKSCRWDRRYNHLKGTHGPLLRLSAYKHAAVVSSTQCGQKLLSVTATVSTDPHQ